MSMQGLAVRAVLVVAGVGLVVWAGRRLSQAVSAPGGYVDQLAAWGSQAVTAVTPWSPDNVAYQTANRGVQSIPGFEHDTVGTAIYRLFHPDEDDHNSSYYTGPEPERNDWSTGGGRYNNPSAYVPDYSSVTPAVEGPGGAAFGIYPRVWGGGASGSW